MFLAADLLHELGSSSDQDEQSSRWPSPSYLLRRRLERESWTRCIIMQSGLFDLSCQPLHVPAVLTAERAASLRSRKRNHSSRCLRLGTLPRAEAYWWQLSGAAIVTGSDVHIRKVSHVVALITRRLRGQKDGGAETFGISCDSSRFLFVLTGKSGGDQRNANCFRDPQSWRGRTWIDQRGWNLNLCNWIKERKWLDFYLGERMEAFSGIF